MGKRKDIIGHGEWVSYSRLYFQLAMSSLITMILISLGEVGMVVNVFMILTFCSLSLNSMWKQMQQ